MNREQRRNLVKKAHKSGMSNKLAKAFAEIASGTGEHTPAQEINEGDKIRLDIDAIKARKNYAQMSEKYHAFIDNAGGMVYTAHVEKTNLISLKEEPQWLFWSGDLIKVSSAEEGADYEASVQ